MTPAVILLNWNHAEQTLRAARQAAAWNGLNPLVVIVDNDSENNEADCLAQALPDAVVLRAGRNLGFAGGNNLGIRSALEHGARSVALLNCDAHVDASCAQNLLAQLAQNPALAAIGPLLEEPTPQGFRLCAGGLDIVRHVATRRFLSDRQAAALARTGRLIPCDYVPGTVFFARTDLFDRIGFLDEDYFFSGEIADLCLRARQAGLACAIDPTCRARHEADPNAPPRSSLYLYYSLRNRFLHVHRHNSGSPALLARWTLLALVMLARSWMRGQQARSQAIRLAMRDARNRQWGNRNDLFLP